MDGFRGWFLAFSKALDGCFWKSLDLLVSWGFLVVFEIVGDGDDLKRRGRR